jgi:hypothetical protein
MHSAESCCCRHCSAVSKNHVSFYEKNSHKFVRLPLVRWARFLAKIDYIDEQLECAFAGRFVDFQTHIGGPLYACINSSMRCPMVDLREFYLHPENGVRPTRTGISVFYDQWKKLKNSIPAFHNDNECALTARDCTLQPDHCNQEALTLCSDCNPFTFNLVCASTIDAEK